MQNCLMSRKLPTLTRTPLVTRPTSLLSRAAPANRSQEPVNRNRRGPPTNPVRTITSTQPTTPSSQSCRTIRLSISWTTRTRLRLGITRTRGRRRKRPTKSDITYSPHPHPFRHTEGMGARPVKYTIYQSILGLSDSDHSVNRFILHFLFYLEKWDYFNYFFSCNFLNSCFIHVRIEMDSVITVKFRQCLV